MEDMALSLTDLIVAVGDDVQFQNLDNCAKTLDYHHKKGTTITFGTDMNIAGERGTEKLGLVVWLDREKVAEILEKSKT
jgi:hypothetical protein